MESSSSGQLPPRRRRDRLRAAINLTSRPLSTLFRGRSSSVSHQPAIPSQPARPDEPADVIRSVSDARLRQPGNRTGMLISLSPILHPPFPQGSPQPEGDAGTPTHISPPLPVQPQQRVLIFREPSNPQVGYGGFRAEALRAGADARLLQRGNRSCIHDFNMPLLKSHCLSGLPPSAPAQEPPVSQVARPDAIPSAMSLLTPLSAHSLTPPTTLTDSDVQRERRSRRATWAPTIFEDTEVGHTDTASTNRSATPPPILRSSLQHLSPASASYSGPALSVNSPLSSISLLLSQSVSNMSIGAAHAANQASTADSSTSQQEATGPGQTTSQNRRSIGWLHQARSRLSRGSTSFRPRLLDLHTILRNNHSQVSSDGDGDIDVDGGGNASIGAIMTHDDMPSFTIVGIRRISTNGEDDDDDFLPPYLRELIGPTEEIDDTDDLAEDYFPHERRRSIFRIGRQRSRPRSLYGSGSLRRNGVVEPDPSASAQEPPRHAYVLYVIRATLPEGHPLLSEPNLLTDELTHETMLRIGSVLGQVKRPVASENEVQAAGGVFVVEIEAVEHGEDKLVAVSREGEERFAIPPIVENDVMRPERCNICLSDYERYEELRRLNECGHYFHADCIKFWLTEGRNSCPLCRGEGVNKKSTSPAEGSSSISI